MQKQVVWIRSRHREAQNRMTKNEEEIARAQRRPGKRARGPGEKTSRWTTRRNG